MDTDFYLNPGLFFRQSSVFISVYLWFKHFAERIVTMSMAISGQKTVADAGTEVALGAQPVNGPLMVKALPGNTGAIYLGRHSDGTLGSTTGLALSAGEVVIFDWVGSLANILLDAAVSGEGVSWILLAA